MVEPAEVVDAGPHGPRRLYIALTRAVSQLCVLHARPLPDPLLTEAAASAGEGRQRGRERGQPMRGRLEASSSAARARITSSETTSASAANTTDSSKAIEMPCESTLPAYGARNWATWSLAALRLAVPNTVTRIDSPSDPPTCCMTFSRLEAAPDSSRDTPETATIVSGTNSSPMPNPNTSIGPRIPSR